VVIRTVCMLTNIYAQFAGFLLNYKTFVIILTP